MYIGRLVISCVPRLLVVTVLTSWSACGVLYMGVVTLFWALGRARAPPIRALLANACLISARRLDWYVVICG